MIDIKAKHYILAPHVLQKNLNDGEDKMLIDFGTVQAQITILGTKSIKPVEIKEVTDNEVDSDDRSKERSNKKVRKATNNKQAAAITLGQETEVEN